MQSYAGAFAAIADEEMDTWETGVPMRTLEPMQRITLRAILQTIFGAHGESLAETLGIAAGMRPLAITVSVMLVRTTLAVSTRMTGSFLRRNAKAPSPASQD